MYDYFSPAQYLSSPSLNCCHGSSGTVTSPYNDDNLHTSGTILEENESIALISDSKVQSLDTNDDNNHYHHGISGIYFDNGDIGASVSLCHRLSPSGTDVQSSQTLNGPTEDCLSLDPAVRHTWDVGYISTELCHILKPTCDYQDQNCSNQPTQVEEYPVVADIQGPQHQYIENVPQPQNIMLPHGPYNRPQNPQWGFPDDLLDPPPRPRSKSSKSFEESTHRPSLANIAPAPYPRVDYHHPIHPETAGDNLLQKDARDKFLIASKLSGMSYKEIKTRGHFREAESTLRGRFRTLTKAPEQRLRKPVWTAQDVSIVIPQIWSKSRMYHKLLDPVRTQRSFFFSKEK